MGKRGPSPKGEYADKSAVLSTRISAELRTQLEKSVKANGLTLSREIEHRLRRSFYDDAARADLFGNHRNFRLMQLVGLAMTLRDPEREASDWLEDPALFAQVLRTIHHLLWAIRPPGTEEQFSDEGWRAEVTAESVWLMIHEADAALPLGVTPGQHRANVFKADLGEILDRVRYGDMVPEPPASAPSSKRKAK